MAEEVQMKIIARVRSDFPSKFGIPRQSGLANELKSRIIFEPEYRVREAFRGIEDYSHIWILWQFSEAVRKEWSPTVRPPKLGGNTRVGVFATRSPFRPNSIALSSVKLDRVEFTGKEGPVLHISGADIMDNSPVFDIKPYLAYTDSHPDALSGFAPAPEERLLDVYISDALLAKVPHELQNGLIDVLKQDPRPAYRKESDRVFGFCFAGFEISFTVENNTLMVKNIDTIK